MSDQNFPLDSEPTKLGVYLDPSAPESVYSLYESGEYPSFAHTGDAGFDIRVTQSGVLPSITSMVVENIHTLSQSPVIERYTNGLKTLVNQQGLEVALESIIRVIPTGLKFDIPYGYELQVRMRSGLAFKHGLTLVNGVGTIDSNYTGEVNLAVANLGIYDYVYEVGERMAQCVLVKLPNCSITRLPNGIDKRTSRGSNGYGSTGKH